jgi:putative cell wall-binding protein
MAAPHVAGAAALVRSQYPTWTRSQVEQRLTSTALDLGSPGFDIEFGYGLLRADTAVGSTTPPPPPPGPDDSIPGVELPPSPVGGSVDSFTDVYDVYRIALSSGQTLSIGLTSSFVDDIDLHLYGPDATSLADEPLASSESPDSSEEITHAVFRSGVYYMAVMAWEGSGSYTLTHSVSGGPQPDDEIPGIPAPASPITDSLIEPTDIDDVYGLSLAEGQQLSVSLTGPVGTDFDVCLFGPGATSIWVDEPVAQAVGISYPDTLTYVVPTTGVYYLDIRSHAGNGSYTVTYSVITPPSPEADDDIPGVPIGSSPRAGTVDQPLDPVDVYSISLDGGKRLTVDLTGPAGTDFDVFLYGPEAGSLNSATPLAWGMGGTYPEQVRYQVPSLGGGTYYVAVRAYSGAGVYGLSYRAEDTIEVELLGHGFETWSGPWSVWSSSGATWGRTSYRESAGSYSAYCAGGGVAAPGPYQDAMDAWLTAGPFDLSTYDGATLTFDMWMVSEADFDELSVGASIDDETYQTLVWSGSSGGWTTITLDLADLSGDGTLDYTGEPAVWVSFIFNSNESLAYEGAYIDNVRLSGTRIDAPNSAPVLDPIVDKTVDELTQLAFTVSATDADGDPLTYSATGLPSGAAFNPATRTFTWTPSEAQGPGTYTVTFVVSDGRGGTDSEPVTITVAEVNVAPVLSPIGTKSATVGVPLTFTVSATDADLPANTLTYSATGLPAGATFTPANRTFSWTPTAAGGPYSVTFTVSDGRGGTDAGTIQITATAAPAQVVLVPVEGPNRYATAIAISKKAFPTGSEYVIIATGLNWPDALGGSALGGALDAPILLTRQDVLPAEVRAEIVRLGATKAIVLGGTPAVSAAVFSQIDAIAGVSVERISGPNRYDTANKVAARTIAVMRAKGGYDGTAFVATGMNFPDALGASPLAAANGWPIYLANPAQGNNASLVALMKASGVTDAILLGGSNVVADSIRIALGTTFETRLSGANRYDTSVRVATYGVTNAGLSWDKLAIATGTNFPDALSGGVLQGKINSVLLLTPTASLNDGVAAVLRTNKASIFEVRFLGSTAAVSSAVRTSVWNILKR